MNKRLRLYAARWVYFKTYYQEMRNLTERDSKRNLIIFSAFEFLVDMMDGQTKVRCVDIKFFLAFCAHVLDGAWPEKRQDESLVLLAPERRQEDQTGDYFALSRESLH